MYALQKTQNGKPAIRHLAHRAGFKHLSSLTYDQAYDFIRNCTQDAHLEFQDTIAAIHGLWTPGEEIAVVARPKINSHSQILRYG